VKQRGEMARDGRLGKAQLLGQLDHVARTLVERVEDQQALGIIDRPADPVVQQVEFLGELGVPGLSGDPAWRERPGEGAAQGAEAAAGLQGEVAEAANGIAGDELEAVRLDLGENCERCKLHRLGRRQVVFGVGNPEARLMFVGEAPGRDEDEQGIPFVGRAGQLLTKMIEAMGYSREEVYIANVIKCRPPENRNPQPDEVFACEPFLFRQVEAIKPAVIVALGTFAAQALLKTQDSISRLRGRIFSYGGARLVPTFHPAYLLRSPERKRDAWEDLKRAKALLDQDSDPASET